MELSSYLAHAGLTEVESRVYMNLLEMGSSLCGEISRKSGIHRRTVYDLLERLIGKGLVAYIKKNNRRYYECVHPKRFLELIKEKESEIDSIMPDLVAKYEGSTEKGETVFYRGTLGIKSVFEDQLSEGKEILIMSGSPKTNEILKFYLPHYNRERVKRNIKVRILFDEKHREEIESKEKRPLMEIRYLPKDSGSLAATNVYGDNVAIILWIENPVAILIKQDKIAGGYRKMFELLWQMAKE